MSYDTIDLLDGVTKFAVGVGNNAVVTALPYTLFAGSRGRVTGRFGVDLSAYAGKHIRGWHFRVSVNASNTGSGTRRLIIGMHSGSWAGETRFAVFSSAAWADPVSGGVTLEDVFPPTTYPVAEIVEDGDVDRDGYRGLVLEMYAATGNSVSVNLTAESFEVAELYISDAPTVSFVGEHPSELSVGEEIEVPVRVVYGDDVNDPVIGARISFYGGDGVVGLSDGNVTDSNGETTVTLRGMAPGVYTLYYRYAVPFSAIDDFRYYNQPTGYPSPVSTITSIKVSAAPEPPEPVGPCFWTDLVNATQECGSAPEPEPVIPVHFANDFGDGSGDGMFRIPWRAGGDSTEHICGEALFNAIEGSEGVYITGVSPPFDPWPQELDCGFSIEPASIEWDDFGGAHPMMEYGLVGGVDELYWANGRNNIVLDQYAAYFVRIEIIGGSAPETFYGVLWMGGGI